MNLGERIYTLRTAKSLSQGDLAEALDVSRQSISKWENNMAVPELDKLIKMSELFGVTLDELVRGETTKSAESAQETAQPTQRVIERVVVVEKRGGSKTAGIVLLALSGVLAVLLLLLGGGIFSMMYVLPFLLCGIVCMSKWQHKGLLCLWSIYLSVYLYLRFATGIDFSIITLTLIFEPSWNYVRLATGWGQFLAYVLLVFASCWKTRCESLAPTRNHKICVGGIWALYVFLIIGERVIKWLCMRNIEWNYGPRSLIAAVIAVRLAVLAFALVRTAMLWRGWRAEKKIVGDT